jgi:hypothetical protein
MCGESFAPNPVLPLDHASEMHRCEKNNLYVIKREHFVIASICSVLLQGKRKNSVLDCGTDPKSWAEAFVAELSVGGERVPFERVFAHHLDAISKLRSACLRASAARGAEARIALP